MTQYKSTLNQSPLQSQNIRTTNLLELTYQELHAFSESDDFWNLFDTAFGKGYNRSAATKLRSQWQSGDFTQFPAVEIISSSILGNANGAYATSNNKIYLSETFVNTATTATLISVLLEEYGHFVDAHVNLVDSAGDEGAIFAALVESKSLDSGTIATLKTEDDRATITLNGQVIGVEQSITNPSGDSRIDTLLSGYKWGGTTITYSFFGGGSYYGDEIGVASVSDTVKQNVRYFLENTIEPLININFVEVSDSATSYGQIRYLSAIDPDYAYAYNPVSTDTNQGNSNDIAGDVVLDRFNYNDVSLTSSFQGGLGTYGYATLIHETLHALGLKHPGNYNGTGTGEGPFLPLDLDNEDNTVMSYNDGSTSPGTPMPYDLLALQYLYGARSFNNSNTTYSFSYVDRYSDGLQTVGSSTTDTKLTIWDSGGIDTLDFSGLTANGTGYRFDLNEGGWLTTQTNFNGTTYQATSDTSGTNYLITTAGTRIGYGVTIEKAIGSSSDDTFYGNSLNNYINGSLGNDTIYGGIGTDVAIYAGSRSQYQISRTSAGVFTITDSMTTRDGIDVLSSIESIQFSDQTMSLGPVNDNFANRSILTGNIVSATASNADATGETGEPYLDAYLGAVNSVWWTWTATANGNVTIHTNGSDFDTVLGVYTGNNVSSLTTITTNDDGYGAVGSSLVTFAAVSGTSYQIAVDGYGAATGNINLALDFKPTITVSNVTLAVAPASVNEDGTANLVYTFTRTGVTTNPLTVNYGVGGTATLGSDYAQTGAASFTATTGTVTFAAGATTATVTVNPTVDTTVEANETIALTLASGTGYTVGTTTAVTGTILNDDTNVTLAAAPASVNEDGTANLVYTFTRTGVTTNPLTVNYGVGGTATLGSDYAQTGAASFTATTGTVTFAAGATTATVTVNPTVDTTVEANETIALTLASGTGYTVGTTTAVTGTILNDDTNVTLAAAPASVNEDGTANLVYTFTRTGVTTNPLTVNYGVGGTATLGSDYAQTGAASFTATTGTVTFAAGATTATVTVNPTVDTTVEANETIALTLASGTGYTVGTTTAVTGTILNDDTNITLAVAPASVNEDGTANLVYTFTRAGVTTNPLTVNYGVGGTATLGSDYAVTGAASFTATTGTVTFAAGATTATVTVDPTVDTTVEANETIALTLASGTGYTVGTTTAVTGTILNDDILSTIAIADTTIVEGMNGNPTQSLITVSLNKASTQAVSVNYATSNVTAIAGSDYTATTGTLTFAAGQTSLTIAVPILNDNLNEVNETFVITLSTPTNATIADSQATITITDTLVTSVTTTLPDLVENLTLTGAIAINGAGNAGANFITGNSANNILAGLDGNDIYIYDADLAQGSDTINETMTGGIDTLNLSLTAAAININLGLTTAQTVNANLQLVIPVIALENFVSGTGNDRITGNILNNTIQGGGGDDRISGAGGNDIIFGQGGNDIISGGAGNDIFYYNGLLSAAVTANAYFGLDTIADFTSTQDKIYLSKATFGAITSAAYTAIGSNFVTVDDDTQVATQTAAIVYSLNSGGLFYNQNGATAGLGTNGGEFANLLASPTLLATDFVIAA